MLEIGCKQDDSNIPEEDPYTVIPLSPIADVIPYEALGRGKICFNRVDLPDGSGIHVIDIDNKKTSGFKLNNFPWPCEPSISPDGTKIACSMFTYKTYITISIMNIDGSNCHPISHAPWGSDYPSWTPDGSKVLFYAGISDGLLFMQSPIDHATDSVVLTKFGYGDDPEWFISPSGGFSISSEQKLVCVSYGNKLRGILSIDPYIGKSGVSTLFPMSANLGLESPAFSPDGNKIAFLEIEHDLGSYNFNSVSVNIINPDGSDLTQLVKIDTYKTPVQWAEQHRMWNVSLCWSPDGTKILFTAPTEEYGCHLFVIKSDGSGLTQVTDNINAYDFDVSWSK